MGKTELFPDDRSYAFLDLETTGLNPDTDEIIEIGVIIAKKGKIKKRYNTFIKPAGKLPFKIIKLTGITDQMLEDAPRISDIRHDLLGIIGKLPVAGHNVAFDISFLEKKLGHQFTNPLLDTMDLVQFLIPGAESYRLQTVRNILGIDSATSHRALEDAEAACRVFFGCIDILGGLNREILFQINTLLKNRDWSFAQVVTGSILKILSGFPAGKSEPLFAFMSTERPEEVSLFSGEEITPEENNVYTISDLAVLLGQDGIFAQKNPHYRFRQGQVDMLKTVTDGFKNSKHMIIEAGTGTGKTLAYLLPSVVWAVSECEKVVVATHTINLQEQLWNRDLPDIRKITGIDFKACLVKGRSNYLCLRRWEERINETGLMEKDEIILLLKILVWLTKTLTGDKSEINIMPAQKRFWNELVSEQDTCLGPLCRRFNNGCFVSQARRRAEAADLLIVNHSLLMADIKTENRLLPQYEYLIIDEAHHLEDTATEQMGDTIDFNSLKSVLRSLNRGFARGGRPGLLSLVKQVFRNLREKTGQSTDEVSNTIEEAADKVSGVIEGLEEIEEFLVEWATDKSEEVDESHCLTVRIREAFRSDRAWEVLDTLKANFVLRSEVLIKSLKKLNNLIESTDREDQKAFGFLAKDIGIHLKFLSHTNELFRSFYEGAENTVHWIEIYTSPKPSLNIRSAPVSVSRLLTDLLFERKRSVLLTSATMSVGNDFEHFTERVGLSGFQEERVIKGSIPSPFLYERQSLLCVIRDLPDPGEAEECHYTEEIAPVITDVVKIFDGRVLVLFNSHRMLRDIYERIRPVLESSGITLLGHKIDGGRSRLAEEFRLNNKAVLLGARSFWEGVDLPGDMLKCVIIVRLPFVPPNTPVMEARIEEISGAKRDAFYSYSLPEAVIKFKQGFGRLIRTEEDEGIVLVLDRRIVDRKYGRKFLHSLPVKTHFKGDSSTVLQKMSDWINGERQEGMYLNILGNSKDIEKYLKNRPGK